MAIVRITDIEWDFDEDDVDKDGNEPDLPDEVVITNPTEEMIQELKEKADECAGSVADYLADTYGFCCYGFAASLSSEENEKSKGEKTMDKTEFLKKADEVCLDCNYGDGRECESCPIRKGVDMMNAGLREEIRFETGIARHDLVINGAVLIRAGQKVSIIDAAPEQGDPVESVDGYCDAVLGNGDHVVQGTWNDFDGLVAEKE